MILTAAEAFGTAVFIIVFWIIIWKNRKEKTFAEKIAPFMQIDKDPTFQPSEIAERISLLRKFIRTNFAKSERYTGENKKLFDALKSLSPKNREMVIDELSRML